MDETRRSAALSDHAPRLGPRGPHPLLLTLHRFCLGALVFTGAFVVFEGPYNAAFIIAALVMFAAGARVTAPLAPFLLLTLIYVGGGLASLIAGALGDFMSQRYVVTMFFLACTSFYFAIVLQEETSRRMAIIRNATLASAIIACFIGLVGFFDVGGLAESFRVYEGRASGTFRDPNVFGSFLIFPAILLMQDALVGRPGLWWRAPSLMLVALMIFLTFSRGSWLAFAGAALILAALTLITERDKARRVAMMGLAAFAALALLVAAILSIDDIRAIFEQRAQLLQSYDEGRFGRFGKIIYSLPLLFDNPLGLGPLRYADTFFEDPHNVIINGFANFGWVGGSAYIALIVSTCYVGFRHALQPSPWRPDAIAVGGALFVQMLQGVQIDTNSWRHFNMMIGLIWGLTAAWATMRRRADRRASAPAAPIQTAIPASAIIAAR